MGDFNIDLLNYESHHLTEEYINTMNFLSFQPMITKPTTRITDHSATLIDHIFFNSLEYYTVSGNIIYDISDHLPNFVLIDNANIQNKSKKVFKRDYSIDRNALIEDFKMIDWTYHFHSRNTVDEMYDTFYAMTNEIINKHIPLKKLSRKAVKQTAKPWVTPAIQTSIIIKNKYYKKFISTKQDFYFAKFKLYCNRLQFLIKLSKQSFYDDYFNKYSSDTKKMWSGIKQIITTKSKSLNHPLKISAQNKHEITDPQQIANSFNEYFANIGQNLVTTIPTTNNSPTDYLKKLSGT